MPSSAPTPRQQAYLDYIATYCAKYGWAPTQADMQRCFCVSAPSVHTMVLTLERRGFLRRIPGQARGISLIPLSTSPRFPSAPQPASLDGTPGPAPAQNKNIGWTDVRPALSNLTHTALLALIKDLYVNSDTARDLINVRCLHA